ncbi:uncharacterized protein B0I36DRAFT_345523 [Microdochium trichocladiopsis]|uniref:Uncharacterized protein n=1 Tax=Microdochium trichocladiopsis TaxID=1682393 RepID=A0A9P8YDS7_9PEZI|nr:uncharacterized protein B0I36DRAFT_345523 [Microdochium trichocladiopsis]KAH7037399.1 hypothetical protein B0I36DRAFT_345523 [Microdochium trichocladiopsis]
MDKDLSGFPGLAFIKLVTVKAEPIVETVDDDDKEKKLLLTEHLDEVLSCFCTFVEDKTNGVRPLKNRSNNAPDFSRRFNAYLVQNMEGSESKAGIATAAQKLGSTAQMEVFTTLSKMYTSDNAASTSPKSKDARRPLTDNRADETHDTTISDTLLGGSPVGTNSPAKKRKLATQSEKDRKKKKRYHVLVVCVASDHVLEGMMSHLVAFHTAIPTGRESQFRGCRACAEVYRICGVSRLSFLSREDTSTAKEYYIASTSETGYLSVFEPIIGLWITANYISHWQNREVSSMDMSWVASPFQIRVTSRKLSSVLAG